MPRARDNGYIASHGVPDAVELWKRVTVGPDVFEALSSEERISILKLLDQNRQMTGTDVANVLAISKSSGNTYYDQAALRAITEANPFPPLPADFPGTTLRVHLGFNFAMDRG